MVGDPAAIDEFVRSKASWKTGALSMRSGVEGRLAEARQLSRDHQKQLLSLIQAHREEVLSNPEDSGDADKKLWRVLDEN
jgi:hypothetical protein